jgi:hypothetical protein
VYTSFSSLRGTNQWAHYAAPKRSSHAPLLQKRLEHERQRAQRRQRRHLLSHPLGGGRPVSNVERDVEQEAGGGLLKLHDGDAGFGDERNLACSTAACQRKRQRAQPVARIAASRVQDDGVYVTGWQVQAGGKRAKDGELSTRPD